MPATTVYQLPYPAASDPADVPTDMQELADQIELILGPGSANGQVPVWNNTTKKWAPGTPGGALLAYQEITAPVTLTATSEATATTIVTASAVTFDGSAVELEFFAGEVAAGASAGSLSWIVLYDGGSSIGLLAAVRNPAAALSGVPVLAKRRFSPSAGSHTYSIRAFYGGTAGSVQAGPGGVGQRMPAYIAIRKAV